MPPVASVVFTQREVDAILEGSVALFEAVLEGKDAENTFDGKWDGWLLDSGHPFVPGMPQGTPLSVLCKLARHRLLVNYIYCGRDTLNAITPSIPFLPHHLANIKAAIRRYEGGLPQRTIGVLGNVGGAGSGFVGTAAVADLLALASELGGSVF